MEEFIKKTCEEFFQGLTIPLGKAVGETIAKSYNEGWEACKKFYNINDEKFLKEQEDIETKYMGSYKTTASTDNGKKYKDYRKEIEL